MAFALRLREEQKRDLEIVQQATDGAPAINGLIQLAIDRYLANKLQEPAVKAVYEATVRPQLTIISQDSVSREARKHD